MLYKFQNQITQLDKTEIDQALTGLEYKLRTGKFAYSAEANLESIRDSVVKGWSKDAILLLRTKVKELSAGNAPNTAVVMRAMSDVLCNTSAQKGQALRSIIANVGLATLFGRSPATGGEPLLMGGKRVLCKPMMRLSKLIVDQDEVGGADTYVLSLFFSEVDRAVMVGWASQDDVRKFPKGNYITDPENCRWSKMAHYASYMVLRPMSEFLEAYGASSLVDGLLLEQIPQQEDVPALPQSDMSYLLEKGEGGEDFWKILGL